MNETRFGDWVDFDALIHVRDSLYKGRSPLEVTRSASNSISNRVSLTSLSFGMTTELFAYRATETRLSRDGCVLDACCGEPSLFNLMADSMYFPNYVGLDIRLDALEQFGNPKHAMVIADDILKTEAIRPESMEGIVFCESLEHFERGDGIDVLERLFGWLRDDGFLILTTPIKPRGVEIDMKVEWRKWDHITYYEDHELVELLEWLGFEVVHLSYGKFMGRRMTYRRVREGIVDKFGDVGAEIFDHVSSLVTPRLAGTIFSHYAGDVGGHIQLVLEKR